MYIDPSGYVLKEVVREVGSAYLVLKKYYFAERMWRWGFDGKGKSPTGALNTEILNTVWGSTELWNKIATYKTKLNSLKDPYTAYYGGKYDPVTYSSGDKLYGIGKMNVLFWVDYWYYDSKLKKRERVYYVFISVNDTYDFDQCKGVAGAIGYASQTAGFIKPYYWGDYRYYWI